MAQTLDRFAIFSYLNGGTIAGKWVLKDKYDFLSVTSLDPCEVRSYQAFYDEDGNLVLTFTNVITTQKKTSIKHSAIYDISGTALLLELVSFMISTGTLSPTLIANILSPTR